MIWVRFKEGLVYYTKKYVLKKILKKISLLEELKLKENSEGRYHFLPFISYQFFMIKK